MKTNLRKRSGIWEKLLAGLAACVSLICGTLGCIFTVHPRSNAASVAPLSAIHGYSATDGYSYVYFGEYPQTRVLEINNGTGEGKVGWANFPSYTSRSTEVSNIIKGYIEALCTTYYTVTTKPDSHPYHSLYQANYDWKTTTVSRFYPQEDCENANISFEAKTGYYTLKTKVTSTSDATYSYLPGTKFHTYNQNVDAVQKYFQYSDDNGATRIDHAVGGVNRTVNNSAATGGRTNISNWMINVSGTMQTYNSTSYSKGETYLYLVEPIKWRVLSRTGNQIYVMSEMLIDSTSASRWQNIGEYKYQSIRRWLNGYSSQQISTNDGMAISYSSNRTFMDMALDDTLRNALVYTSLTQEQDASYYAGAWHCYTQLALDSATSAGAVTSGTVESRPTYVDAIWVPMLSDFVESNGLDTTISRIAYNSDYTIDTGNRDEVLAGIKTTTESYKQNLTSGAGGCYLLSGVNNIDYKVSGLMKHIIGTGDIPGGYDATNTIGIRPCLKLDLDKVNLAQIGTDASGNPIPSLSTRLEPLAENPTSSATAIDLTVTSHNGTDPLALYEYGGVLEPEICNVCYDGWDWSGNRSYRYNCENSNYLGGFFAVKSTNYETGEVKGFGAVSKVVNSQQKIGTFWFKEQAKCREDIYYILGNKIYSVTMMPGRGMVILLNGVSGNDSSTGVISKRKTLEACLGEMTENGLLYCGKELAITQDTTIDLGFTFSIGRMNYNDMYSNAIFNITNGATLTFKNVTLDGGSNGTIYRGGAITSTAPLITVSGGGKVVFGENTVIQNVNYADGNGGIISVTGAGSSVSFEGTEVKNCKAGNGGVVYATSGATVNISGANFHDNSATNGGCIYADTGAGTVTISSSTFDNNSVTTKGGCIYTNANITINDSTFTNNKADNGDNTDGVDAGGVIYTYSAPVSVQDSLFEDNSAVHGGVVSCGVLSSFNFINSKFYNNKTLGEDGGVCYGEVTFIAQSCEFIGNSARSGGALKTIAGSSLKCENCLFDGNKSTSNDGGAIGNAGDIELTNCHFMGNTSLQNAGGSVSVYGGSSIIISDCLFYKSYSWTKGSALYVYGSGNISITIEDVQFISNGAHRNSGGSDGALNITRTDGTVTANITGCTFDGNTANTDGGALYASMSGTLTIDDCSFTNNIAGGHGGAAMITGCKTTVSNCLIDSNEALYQGAMYVNQGTSLKCENLTISNNTSKNSDGGNAANFSVMMSLQTPAIYTRCRILNNSALTRGVIGAHPKSLEIRECLIDNNSGTIYQYSGLLTIVDTEICNNLASIYKDGTADSSTITNCYFHDNVYYGSGGAIWSRRPLTINGGLFERNTATNGGAIYCTSTLTINGGTYRYNTATNEGGAIAVTSVGVTINDTEIYGNKSGKEGGACHGGYTIRRSKIYDNVSLAGYTLYMVREIEDCVIEDNVGVGIAFGYNIKATGSQIKSNKMTSRGIQSYYDINIKECEFKNNDIKGAIVVIFLAGRTLGKFENSIFENNSGRIIQSDNSILAIKCTFTGNSSPNGSILYNGGGAATIPVGATYYSNEACTVEVGTLETAQTQSGLVSDNVLSFVMNETTYYAKVADATYPRSATFTDCVFSGNTSAQNGMIWMTSNDYAPAKLTLENCEVYGNLDKAGAVLQTNSYEQLTVKNSTFHSNSGTVSGGVLSVASNATATVSGCKIYSNAVTGDDAKGNFAYVKTGGTLNLDDALIRDITSTNGAVYTEAESTLNVRDGLSAYGNTGGNGGVFNINGVANFGGQSGNKPLILPDEYQQVEYIRNNRYFQECRINTGISWKDTGKIEVSLNVVVASDNNANLCIVSISGNNPSAPWVSYNTNQQSGLTNMTEIVDGDTAIWEYSCSANTPVVIAGWADTAWGGVYNYKRIKLYGIDRETLVRDFIPCYRKSDGEVGMYDLVEEVFYTNQGTGTFGIGSTDPKDFAVNLKIYNNTATNGGAIYVGKTGSVKIENTEIYGNQATNGGAIYLSGTLQPISGNFTNNTATNGGGIYVGPNGALKLGGVSKLVAGEKVYDNFTLTGNTATNGGGVYIAGGGSAVVNHATITANKIVTAGGGIYIEKDGNCVLEEGAVISKNAPTTTTATVYGLGIANYGNLLATGGEIRENVTTSLTSTGGGIYSGVGSTIDLSNVLFTGNQSVDGIAVYMDTGTAYINNCEVTANKAVARGVNSVADSLLGFIDSCTVILGTRITRNEPIGYNNMACIYAEFGEIEVKNTHIMDNTSYYSPNGTIYFQNCIKTVLDNCLIIGNLDRQANGGVCAIGKISEINNLIIKNCQIISNYGYGATRVPGVLLVANSQGEIIKTKFIDNLAPNTEMWYRRGSPIIYISNSQLNFDACNFEGNISRDSFVQTSNTNINILKFNDCTFTDNSAIGLFYEGSGDPIQGVGGAIYMTAGELILSGETTFTENKAGFEAGAIYIASGAKLTITKGAKIVIDGNLKGALYNATTVTVAGTSYPSQEYDGTSGTPSNLYFAEGANLAVLEGGLAEGSRIGLSYGGTLENGMAIIKGKAGFPLTPDDVNKFFLDGSDDYYLRLDAENNQIVLVSKYATGLQVIAQDLVKPIKFANKATGETGNYAVDPSYIKVYKNGAEYADYTVMFADYEDGPWLPLEDMSTFSASSTANTHTIYYKVTDNQGGVPVTGSFKLKISGKTLYLVTAPTASLQYNQTLDSATIFNGLVQDEMGNAVSGTWAFASPSTKPTSVTATYSIVFTPYDVDLYNNTISTPISVNIGYSTVFYYALNNTSSGAFYTDVNHTMSTRIDTLGEMVPYMNEGGTIVFLSTYNVGVGVNISQDISTNKTIYLTTYSANKSSAMISIVQNATPFRLTLGGGSGQFIIDGTTSYSGTTEATSSAIINAGELVLGSNVIIRNFTNTTTSGGAITNKPTGKLVINGTKIYNNSVTSETATIGGGAVYNEGIIVINGGEFFHNKAATGIGGFILTVGDLVFNGGAISANTAVNGGGVYVGSNGSAYLLGGEIRQNTATTSGAAAYIKAGGTLNYSGIDIVANRAGSAGGGVYKEDGGTLIESNGNVVVGSTVNSLEELNESNVVFVKQNLLWVAVLSVGFAFLIVSVGVFVIKNKRKFLVKK